MWLNSTCVDFKYLCCYVLVHNWYYYHNRHMLIYWHSQYSCGYNFWCVLTEGRLAQHDQLPYTPNRCLIFLILPLPVQRCMICLNFTVWDSIMSRSRKHQICQNKSSIFTSNFLDSRPRENAWYHNAMNPNDPCEFFQRPKCCSDVNFLKRCSSRSLQPPWREKQAVKNLLSLVPSGGYTVKSYYGFASN